VAAETVPLAAGVTAILLAGSRGEPEQLIGPVAAHGR
jgi:hypothetical protein